MTHADGARIAFSLARKYHRQAKEGNRADEEAAIAEKVVDVDAIVPVLPATSRMDSDISVSPAKSS